jgi:cytochrome c biogenesis protein CcdA
MGFFLMAVVAGAGMAAQPMQITPETRWVHDLDGVHPGGRIRLALEITVPGEYHLQSNTPLDEFAIPTVLTLDPPEGITVTEIVFPRHVEFDVAGLKTAVYEQSFPVGVAFQIAADTEPGSYSIPGTLSYQACDSRVCLMPTRMELTAEIEVVARTVRISRTHETVFDIIAFGTGIAPPPVEPPQPPVVSRPPATDDDDDTDCDVLAELDKFTVLATAGGFMGADDFIEFIDAAEQGKPQRNRLRESGPVMILLLVILGGLALNLTPCVLPLIPINLAIIGAGAQSGSRARGFALGGTYGLAMACVYGVTGLIVTLTAAAFGAINSTVWFNVGIAALFVVLGLAMFDIIHIDFSKFQGKLDLAGSGKRGSFALAFGMGAVAALLAGACVAPVVIQVIVYAGDQYAKGTTSALALPFLLGVGMALPWPFAGAGLSLLPKPGKWMVWVKRGMGVFILAFAGYYAYLAWGIFDNTRVDPAAVRQAVSEQLEGGWTASICGGLTTARAEDRLVLVDMWATWCKNCLAMDKTTLKDETVVARLEDYVKIKYQSEDITVPPPSTMLEWFNIPGLPAYAILRPADGTDVTLDDTKGGIIGSP